jgi:Leucine-rich repeat (LRR) protein
MDFEGEDIEDIEETGTRIEIDCQDLSKHDINNEILNRIGGLTKVKLKLYYYNHDDLESIILPNSIINFDCLNNQITSFAGLKLPSSLEIFNCSRMTCYTLSLIWIISPLSLAKFNIE